MRALGVVPGDVTGEQGAHLRRAHRHAPWPERLRLQRPPEALDDRNATVAPDGTVPRRATTFATPVAVLGAELHALIRDGGGRLLGVATGLLDRHTFVGTPKAPEGKGRVRLVDVSGSGTRDSSWGEDFSYKRIGLQAGKQRALFTRVDNVRAARTAVESGGDEHDLCGNWL